MDEAPQRVKGDANLQVSEERSLSAFVNLASEWNAVVEASGAGPFLRHEGLLAWIESFASEASLLLLLARDEAGRLVGGLPLLSQFGLVCGLPARQIVATANTHSCRFDMVALDPAAAARAFLAHLLKRPGWELLRIIAVPEGGNAWHLHRAAEELGLPVGVWESERSPYLEFPPSYEELLASKSPLFRANLRRRRRQLERLGSLSVERVSEVARVKERLAEGLALERRGWKGRQGSAIAQDPRIRRFYEEMAEAAARHGHLALFFLRLDGRPIAFHYGIVHGGVYYVPKLTYDESLTGCSPGLVLLEEAIKDAMDRGLRGYDFLGGEAEWKHKWSSSVRANHWLFIFRDTPLGRTLRRAKFDWLPSLRRAFAGFEKVWSPT